MRRALSRPVLLEALPVAAIVLIATIVAAIYALQLSEFVIMPDELGYVKQAIVMSHGELPTPGTFWFNSWGLIHSAILAPLYRFFSTTTAFDAGHVIGALIMSSAAIPAYLLARRVLSWRPGALIVAALTVAVPWIAMAGTMMTEVVAYPMVIWACLAMLHGVERPGLRGDLVVALALGAAFLTRTQLLILAPAYVLALAIDVLARRDATLGGRIREALRAHAPMIAVVVIGTLIVLVSGATRRVLGAYSDPTQGPLFPPGTAIATRELVVYVVVAIGAVPLAMAGAWALTTLGHRVSRTEHAFAALLVAVVPLLALIGGSFTVRYAAGINDRYFFYVVPLLFLGAAAALDRPRPRFVPVLLVVGALTTWLIATSLISQQGPSLVSPSMPWHQWLSNRAAEVGATMPHLVAIGTAVAVVAVALVARFVRPRLAVGIVCGALLVWGLVETAYTLQKVADTQKGASADFLRSRGWIDRALPKNARAIAVLASVGTPAASNATWWDTVFWNKSVDKVLSTGDRYEQSSIAPIAVDPKTGRVPALDRYQYVVRFANDTRFGLRGSQTIAGNGGILVLTANRPYQADWSFSGPDTNAAVLNPGESGTVRAFAPASKTGPGKVTLTLAGGGTAPVTVTVNGKRAKIPGGGRAAVTVPVTYSAPGHADVTIRVAKPGGAITLIGVDQA